MKRPYGLTGGRSHTLDCKSEINHETEISKKWLKAMATCESCGAARWRWPRRAGLGHERLVGLLSLYVSPPPFSRVDQAR